MSLSVKTILVLVDVYKLYTERTISDRLRLIHVLLVVVSFIELSLSVYNILVRLFVC